MTTTWALDYLTKFVNWCSREREEMRDESESDTMDFGIFEFPTFTECIPECIVITM